MRCKKCEGVVDLEWRRKATADVTIWSWSSWTARDSLVQYEYICLLVLERETVKKKWEKVGRSGEK